MQFITDPEGRQTHREVHEGDKLPENSHHLREGLGRHSTPHHVHRVLHTYGKEGGIE